MMQKPYTKWILNPLPHPPHSFKGRKQCENPGKLGMDWTHRAACQSLSIVARETAEAQRHEVT